MTPAGVVPPRRPPRHWLTTRRAPARSTRPVHPRRGHLEVGVAGQPGLAVHAHAARAADRLLAGAADADRAVDLVADLEDGVEHRVAARRAPPGARPSRRPRRTWDRTGGSSAVYSGIG